MDTVRSLLWLRPGDTPPSDRPDATLLDLAELEPEDRDQAAAASAALLQDGHRLYLHTHLRQNPTAREDLLACFPTVEPPTNGEHPQPTIYGLSLAGLSSLDHLHYASSLLEEIEERSGATPGLTAIGLWIDSARALHIVGGLAHTSSRLTWIGVDTPALAAELGIVPGASATLDHARSAVALAAQSNALPAVEGPPPRDNPGNDEPAAAERLRALGLRGRATWQPQAASRPDAIFPNSTPAG